MGRRGPKPKPAEAHKMAGTYQPCRHKAAGPPTQPATVQPPPAWIAGEPIACEMWGRVVPQLIAARLVETLDYELIATMSWWWAQFLHYAAALAEAPGDEKLTRLAKSASDKWLQAAIRLGMTPVDRQALRHAAAVKQETNPVLQLLKERAS